MIAALYVQTGGVYFNLDGVDPWDESRDAKLYAGPCPVIAHPPCGPWASLSHLCHKQDATCGPLAVDAVRRWGGCLEHPRGSALFEHCGLPLPGELPDAYGGVTIEVAQVDFGHPARKRTWLYIVGTRALPALPSPREPTHWVSGGRNPFRKNGRRGGGIVPPGIKVCSAQQRRRTPEAFRDFLIEIARAVDPRLLTARERVA